MSLNRRKLLSAVAVTAGVGSLAGCTGDESASGSESAAGSDSGAPTAQSSFFVFGDITARVTGNAADSGLLVPLGQHGHGWEPGPSVREDIRDADLLVHGMKGFQPWIDDIKTDLEADDANVTALDVSSGVELLEAGGGHNHGEEEHEGEDEHDHGEGEGDHDESLGEHAISHACGHMDGGETESLAAASAQGDAPTFSQTHQPYAVELTEGASYVTFKPKGGDTEKYAFFTNAQETVRPVETSVVHEAHSVEGCDAIEEYYVVENGASAVTIELSGDAGTVVTLLAEGVSDDHSHGEEEEHEQEDDDHEGEDEHEDHEGEDEHEDHGAMDPHFWMDPLRVKDATANVEKTLIDMDPGNEDAYTENADTFRAELDDLHEQIEEMMSSASKEVVLVAGHNSWQYFGDRYGMTVEALTNVSPDDRPTTRDIERAQEVIETHDLQYICADPLESQQAAEQLVEETDAEAVLPLTAMPGLTDEWENEDWGYVEVMENVNLPALEDALDA